MENEEKRTFNGLLVHVVIKELIFSNLNYFSNNILTSPENMVKFLNYALNRAFEIAGNEPDIYESPFDEERIQEIWMDLKENDNVLKVVIPSASKKLDCNQIAFVLSNSGARYFTEELYVDLDENEKEYYHFVCEWKLGDDEDYYKHINYGIKSKEKTFTGIVMEIMKNENEEIKHLVGDYYVFKHRMYVILEARFTYVEFGPFYKTLKTFPIKYEVPKISYNNLWKSKKSFNYLLTQIIIPQLMLSDLDNFHENCLLRSADMEQFLNNTIRIAAEYAREYSDDFESQFELEQLESLWINTHTVGEVVIITVPHAKNKGDCIQIAFTTVLESLRYFTLEVTEYQKLLLCEWVLEGEKLCHINYGMIIKQKYFFKKIAEILKRRGFSRRNGDWKYGKNRNYFSVITHKERKIKLLK
jgi:hypothetical protein